MATKAGDNKKTEDDDDDDEDDDSSTQTRKGTFTQAEVNRIASQEKKEGRKAERKAILEKLGLDDIEEAADLISRAQKRREEDETETERERSAATREKEAAAKEKAEAAKERMQARLERKLVRAGVGDKKIDRALSMLNSELDDDADDDAITAAVDSLKEDLPEFFAVTKSNDSDNDDRDNSDDSTDGRRANPPPAGRQPVKKNGKDSASVASDLLAQRHPKRVTAGSDNTN